MSSRHSFLAITSGAAAIRRRISGCSRVNSMKMSRGGGPEAFSGAPTGTNFA